MSVWSLNPVTIFVYLSPFVLLYTVFLFYFDVCSSLYFVSRSLFVIWCVCIVSVFFMVCVHCFSIPCAPTVATAMSLAWYCLSLISNSHLLGLTPAATQLTWQKNTTIKRLSPTVLLCHRCSGRALHHCHISGSHAFWHHHNRFPLWGGSEAATTGTFHYCPHLQLHWYLLKQGLHNNPLGWMKKTCSLVLPQPEEI